MAQQKNRIEEIDYLRGFAILAVIAIHTSANFTKIQNINLLLIINVIIDVFSHFAVPLFVFISGFVLSLNYNGLFSKKIYYKKRAESIFPQYIIFSILYIMLSIVYSVANGEFTPPSIIKIIFYLLTASASHHLWYFAIIIQLYILYPYIQNIYKKFVDTNKTLYFVAMTLIIQLVWIVIKNTAQAYLNSTTYLSSITYFYLYFNPIINTLLSRIFLSHIFYFVLGIYVYQNYKDVKNGILKAEKWIFPTILVITGVISDLWIKGIIEYGSYDKIPKIYFIFPNLIEPLYFSLIFSVLLIISLNISNTKNKYSNIILSLGKYSFGIYLIHVLYIQIIVETIYPFFGISYNQWIFYPVLFILTILLSYESVHQIAHSPYSEIIVGIKNTTSPTNS